MVFNLEDIRNAILAANEASSATAEAAGVPDVCDFRRGYRAALTTLALAFGLPPTIIDGDGDGAVKIPISWQIKEVECYE